MRPAPPAQSPLIPALRSLTRFLPLVAALGLLASLLEGAGIGLFIPLIALFLSGSGGAGAPALRRRHADQRHGSGRKPGRRRAALPVAGLRYCRILVSPPGFEPGTY